MGAAGLVTCFSGKRKQIFTASSHFDASVHNYFLVFGCGVLGGFSPGFWSSQIMRRIAPKTRSTVTETSGEP